MYGRGNRPLQDHGYGCPTRRWSEGRPPIEVGPVTPISLLEVRPMRPPCLQRQLPAPRYLRRKSIGDPSVLWRLPWHNQHKEVFWRLTLDALPTAARLHNASSACVCGAPGPNWLHHFWSCPVAVSLLAVLTDHLQSRDMLPVPLLPLHVLLAQPPSSRLRAGVWRVVCLAFVCALDHVRKAACAIALAGVPSVPPSAPDTSVPLMINRAIARFWDLLTEFCVLNAAPDSWQHSVVASHPSSYGTTPGLFSALCHEIA